MPNPSAKSPASRPRMWPLRFIALKIYWRAGSTRGNNSMTDNLQPQEIWQSQPVEGMKMSAEAIRLRAGKFERKISRRNLREMIAAVFVIGMFSYFFATMPEISYRITWALFIAGTIWVMIVLHLKGRPKTLPAVMGSSSSLEFFRSELE